MRCVPYQPRLFRSTLLRLRRSLAQSCPCQGYLLSKTQRCSAVSTEGHWSGCSSRPAGFGKVLGHKSTQSTLERFELGLLHAKQVADLGTRQPLHPALYHEIGSVIITKFLRKRMFQFKY